MIVLYIRDDVSYLVTVHELLNVIVPEPDKIAQEHMRQIM